ncbi:MAG: carbon-nitrogen hydrolase family protein, partial [Pseudomonadota bacterium]
KRQVLDWQTVNWAAIDATLAEIAELARDLNLWVVLGTARQIAGMRPRNSLVVIDETGAIAAHYDKRILSHTESSDWFSPGSTHAIVTIQNIRIGFALCIEIRFPDLFDAHEAADLDLVLIGSYSDSAFDEIYARAQAATYGLFIGVSTPVSKGEGGLDCFGIGPDGEVLARRNNAAKSPAIFDVDPEAARWEIPLRRARPWRRKIRNENFRSI